MTSMADTHKARICKAVIDLDLTPDQLRWHYIQLVHESHGRNTSETARQLGMHRRTLQRILAGCQPSRKSQLSEGVAA